MFSNTPIIASGLRSTLTIPKVLNGISKTLGIVNQAIPIYRQAKPMIQKGKTLFKLASEINKPEKAKTKNTKSANQAISTSQTSNNSFKIAKNQPVFFQ